MDFAQKILEFSHPVTLFELVPPPADNPKTVERILEKVGRLRELVEGVNIPEIVPEPARMVLRERVEPRILASRIRRKWKLETLINRVVVHDPDPGRWLDETREVYGIRNLVLVGGDSSATRYPGPSVTEFAALARTSGAAFTLGGITIPSRSREVERIHRKCGEGIRFFTSQVLLDSNDIVGLIRGLHGVEARIFLTFAPISDPRDLDFLRRLGVDISADAEDFVMEVKGGNRTARPDCVARSIELAGRVLGHVFENLPPSPPPIGLMVGHINQRNYDTSFEMLKQLKGMYERYVRAQVRSGLPRLDSVPPG